MSVLITGGAGYIGAHIVRLLEARGVRTVVVDDLSSGEADRVGDAPLVCFDLAAEDATRRLVDVIRDHDVSSIVHLAARKQVGESVARPAEYYRANVGALANLVEASAIAGVKRLVFSSSAAVYGVPAVSPVTETAPTVPINPYGETKLVGEWLVADAARAYGIDAISLRYFNVAGAGWDDLGDPNAQNLVTLSISRISRGLAPEIFGDQFDTPDGSGVRDYVHVLDLADAHIAALDALAEPSRRSPGSRVYNVGTGRGSSVREVLAALAAASGEHPDPVVVEPRPGDPPSVVANVDRIAHELGWRAARDLEEMAESAWRAHTWRARSLA